MCMSIVVPQIQSRLLIAINVQCLSTPATRVNLLSQQNMYMYLAHGKCDLRYRGILLNLLCCYVCCVQCSLNDQIHTELSP